MTTPLPSTGDYMESVRRTSKALRQSANIQVHPESVSRLLLSPLFGTSYHQLSQEHGVALPLKFDSTVSELNLIAILSLLNFASGYRLPLRKATGRGAYDSIRALIFGLYLSSSFEDNLLSAKGIKSISREKIADLMQLTAHLHVERPHESIPGVVVGELGGPIYELVGLITQVLNETGDILVKSGYKDLGSFVLEALKEGERVGKAKGKGVDADVVLERLVKAFPAFRDLTVTDGQTTYIFKKALFLIHAIVLRFKPSDANSKPLLPIPDAGGIPIFSDNVIPSMLVHFGVLDLSNATSPALQRAFPNVEAERNLQSFGEKSKVQHAEIEDGPHLTNDDAYALRAAAIDACEVIIDTARNLDVPVEKKWMNEITLPGLDGWLWTVSKYGELRKLPRFVQRDTIFY